MRNAIILSVVAVALMAFAAKASDLAKTRELALQGDADAQYRLAGMYYLGRGVPQDYAEAVKWVRKAAEQGHPGAQFNLGRMYLDSQGVPQNYTEAVKWFRKSAEGGYARGQTALGAMYGKGTGVARDDAEAVRWYRKAAAQGETVAQYNLGWMYEHGLGVTKDYVQAYKLYSLAAKAGDKDAIENRAKLAKQMTPAQIAEADRLYASDSDLRDFLPKAGSIANSKGIVTFKDGTTIYLTITTQFERRRENDREHFVAIYKEEQRVAGMGSGSRPLQWKDQITVYEATDDHVAVVSTSIREGGALRHTDAKVTYDPPLVSFHWPLRKGKIQKQKVLIRSESNNKPPKSKVVSVSTEVKGEEVISIPAGRFTTWRIEMILGERKITRWFAKGKWLVKWQNPIASGELVEFKEPEM